MINREQGMMRSDGFVQVGTAVPLGETLITFDDAAMVRDYLAYDFFDRVPAKTPRVSEGNHIRFGKGFHRVGAVVQERDMFAGAILRHTDQDSWHSIIALVKYCRSNVNNGPQRIESYYRLGAVGHTLTQATKEVRVLRSIGELTVESITTQQKPDIQRKAFQRPITVDDCGAVMGALERVANRAQVQ